MQEGTNQTDSGHAVFAADGPLRHYLVQVGFAAVIALLAAWAVALGLGVLGGFGSLPVLHGGPKDQGHPSAQKGAIEAPGPTPRSTSSDEPVSSTGSSGQARRPVPNPANTSGPVPSASDPVVAHPAHPAHPATGSGSGSTGGSDGVTGKPAGSPGNGQGGSGAPGQLR